MPPVPQPSDVELQVLSVLWEHGPLPARRVRELMPDNQARAYTTVLSIMQVMEKKGLLQHQSDGRAHVYRPTVSRRQVLRPLLRGLVNKVFGGSPAAVVQHLLDDPSVSSEEMSRIQALLDTKRSQR